MKSLIFGSFLAILSLASVSSAAGNSGTFCSGDRVIEFICNQTPVGSGWVAQPDGCFHRDTGRRCDQNGGGGGGYNPGRPNPPPPPAPRPGPGRPNPGNPGRGDLVCSASDRGWEEHGSHRSCGECLRHHDRCIETCSVVAYSCDAQGYDFRGNLVRFSGSGRDQRQAQDDAYRNCSYNARNCQITGCRTQEQQSSRRECR